MVYAVAADISALILCTVPVPAPADLPVQSPTKYELATLLSGN